MELTGQLSNRNFEALLRSLTTRLKELDICSRES